ncbi:putative secreted protein (Por secretion system target) [Kordia periserrulae]|uniref:Putative secreted protein (Por secretion system target) n=1 Tax=Kordia periserrulae TaxID=701523 RepID=A0A2T6BY13_9FLAO|nr:aryl-sulfate sulfotransferase [Kordia periserrulae]PTX60963.1 putative secreted protein (Por secretion system target) [Kordia periserrulae]
MKNQTKSNILFCCIFLWSIVIKAQNTIGTITNNQGTFNGYTLYAPAGHTETYLINNCGEVINQWTSTVAPGNAVYLLENGNLLRAGRIANADINFGGVGGKVELFDWDGNLLWEYTYSSPTVSQHHDVFPMPNGNVLVLAVTTMTQAEAIQAGRDPNNLTQGKLFNEQILELEPVGTNSANIVWEWNVKDHLIQDFDATKDNFGVVEDNPQLLDINFLGNSAGNANWLHYNSIQYDERLDQIVISSRLLSEIYIIDHSTTTAEAATSSGGLRGKGGDFLYRWGNPQAYKRGSASDQKLFGQHYPHFIADGLTDARKMIIFNNGFTRTPSVSQIDIITPPEDSEGVYSYTPGTAYGPQNTDYTYTSLVPTDFYSRILSSAQRLPNGNTLICDGDDGYFFEITPTEEIVWEYVNPVTPTGILSQGDDPTASPNLTFRVLRYAADYPAFTGRTLTPSAPVEQNPDLSNCTILSVNELDTEEFVIVPNPVKNRFQVKGIGTIDKIEVYSALGELILSSREKSIDLTFQNSGFYVVKIYADSKITTTKIIKQ